MYAKVINRYNQIVIVGEYQNYQEIQSKVKADCKIIEITESDCKKLLCELSKNNEEFA